MKVFATDLDGTLVHNKKVTETDKEAIAAFQKENIFGVCTGRPLSCLYDVEGIPFDFYIMCTGALLLDKDRHVIEEHLLDKELVRDIYNHYRDYSNIIVQTESESHFYFTDFIDFPTFTMIKDFEEIKDSKFYSISLVFDTNEEAATFVSDVHDRYPMVSGYQNTNVIDIVSKGISKGTGVKAIKKHFNADKMLGIGDSYNDLPLFKASDYSFTFHSSPDSLKKEVNDVVSSVSEAINKVL